MSILEVKKINKSFGKKQVLKNVSLSINEGEILGFIGPNGAGKTTTIKVILGLQSLDSGEVFINGYDLVKDFTKAIEKVGAIVENPDLYMYLTGYQNLKLIKNMYKGIDEKRIDEVVKLVKLEQRINDKVSKYSLGMRQRLGIAQAIINKPNLLILDEPTNGLDPEGIKELRELLVKLSKQEKMSIFISSHNLAELESFCTTVCIIKNGKVIENSSMKALKEEVSAEIGVYNVKIDNTNSLEKAGIKENIEIINECNFKIKIKKEDVPNFVKKLVENNIGIYEIYEERITLEDAFLKRTGGNVIG